MFGRSHADFLSNGNHCIHNSTSKVSTFYCIIFTRIITNILLYPYYILIMSLICHYYVIITNEKSCYNDSIFTYYAMSMLPVLHHYYLLLHHDYKGDYCYPSVHISVSQTSRCSQQHLKVGTLSISLL